jgi:hypothetical protein
MVRTAARSAYAVAFLALATGSYYFLGAGPTPSEPPDTVAWWRPAGWALGLDWEPLAPLQEIAADVVQARHEGRPAPRGIIPVALSAIPPLAFTLVGFLLFSSPAARVPILALGLALCAFGYYGWLDTETWQDFGWRWPAVLLATCFYVSLFVLGPWLVRAARGRGAIGRILLASALAGSIYVLSIEITGTDPGLAWNLSPWPTLTLYGFLLVGVVLGAAQLAGAAGLAARHAVAGARGVALAAAVATAAAALLHRIPFAETGAFQVAAVALPAVAAAVLAGRSRGAPSALDFAVAGLLVVGSVESGRWQGEYFLRDSRDRIAPVVIESLERHREETGVYPERVEELVPRYLRSIPLPRAGWLPSQDETFLYTLLGDSFLLEFPGVVWVQCAYSPPYREALDEDEPEDDEEEPWERAAPGAEPAPPAGLRGTEVEVLGASWSCESKPPRLW